MTRLIVALFTLGHLLQATAQVPLNVTTNEWIRALLDKSNRLYQRRAYLESLDASASVLKVDPENVKAYLVRGQVYEDQGDHAKAIDAFSEVLKREPGAAMVYQHRGYERFKLGQIEPCLQDFDKFLEFAPEQAPHHWQRGIALYYAGRFDDGRKQFESHRIVNPNDVENAVWHFLCAARATTPESARAAILPVGPDARVPMAEIYALYAGKAKPADVLKAAERGNPSASELKDRLFYAHLYLALYYEAYAAPDKVEEHLTKANGAYAQSHYMGDVARIHQQQLRLRAKR